LLAEAVRLLLLLIAGTQQKSPKNPGNRREFLTSLRIKRPEAGFMLQPTMLGLLDAGF
jgi:hypothetical protein